MAQRFLDQLLKVPNGLLPSGTECMICKEEYGTVPADNGNTEHAVILPCLHHVGSECIAIWLSPDNGLGNSCPLCRTVFFAIHVRDHDDEDNDGDDGDDEDGNGDSDSDSDGGNHHDNEDGNQDDGSGDSDEEEKEEEDDDDGDEGDEGHEEEEGREDGGESDIQRERNPMTLLDAFQRVASCSASSHAREETRKEDGEWFERWPLPTAQQIETNEKRARLELLRPPPPSIFPQPSTSHTTTHSPPPADLETEITRLASAYRTMAFRETLLYIKLTEAGSRMAPLRSPHNGADLSHHQEEMLLWELGQRGAFTDARVRPGYMGMTNRQSWNAHRAKGEVFTYEGQHVGGRGYWSTEVGFGIGAG